MKARCKKELRFPNFTFEVDKEYDFECKVIYLPAEESDVVLARGCRTRHLQYSTEIEVVPDISVCQEKMSLTVHFYDRQYCVRNHWHTPGVKLVGLLPGEELYCFDDFFVESDFGSFVKNQRTLGQLPSNGEFWSLMMSQPIAWRSQRPEQTDYNPSTDLMERLSREFHKQECDAIVKILREYIDNPIVGEITREKVKAAGVRSVVYDMDMDDKTFSEIKNEGNEVRITMKRALLGVAQGHWLIAHNGVRRRLSEKEEAGIRRMEEEEQKEELKQNIKRLNYD